MAASVISIRLPGKNHGKITKWKVKAGSKVYVGSLLALYESPEGSQAQKLKATEVGTVKALVAEEGFPVAEGGLLLEIESCSHPVVMKDMCADCGADLRQEQGRPGDRKESTSASVAMVHSIPELIISEEDAMELGKADEQRLIQDRKLVLLVDLDQTLIHTTNDNVPPNLKDVYHFQLWHGNSLLWYHTKLRPGTLKFLENIAKLYELHICTFGVRMYAHTIANFLDPKGDLFSHRILSRDECFNPTSKTANLKALFPCGDAIVCIIDDRDDVWNFAPNLVHVKPYRYFSGTADINAPPGMGKNDPATEEGRNKLREKLMRKLSQSGAGDAEKDKDENSENSDKGNSKSTPNGEDQIKDAAESGATGSDQSVVANESGDTDAVQSKVTTESGDTGADQSSVTTGSCDTSADQSKDASDSADLSEKTSDKAADQSESSAITESDQPMDTSQAAETGASQSKDTSDSEKSSMKDSKDSIKVADSTKDSEESETKRTDETESTAIKVEKDESNQNTGGSTDKAGDSKDGKEEKVKCDKDSAESQKVMETDEKKSDAEEEEVFEQDPQWDDDDDYLIYLEEILTRVHSAFYEVYDELKGKGTNLALPDMKSVIPYVRRKILKGCNIVFSGVFPTNISPEKSRAYSVAKSLGANVQLGFTPRRDAKDPNATTHLVAARLGTSKVNQAQQSKGVHIVNPDWLWCCNDRWEIVDERLFPLNEETSVTTTRDSPDVMRQLKEDNKRKRAAEEPEELPTYDPVTGKRVWKNKKPKVEKSWNQQGNTICEVSREVQVPDRGETSSSVQPQPARRERAFSASYNPLATFSKEEIDDMDHEVEEIFGESDSDEELRSKVLHNKGDAEDDDSASSTSCESLSGEFPQGWKHKERKRHPEIDDGVLEEKDDEEENDKGDDRCMALLVSSSSENDDDEDDEERDFDSIGSVDEEMAAAVEKEFLSF